MRERGLKFQLVYNAGNSPYSRSREGAWIEIAFAVGTNGRGNGSLP